MTTLAIADQFSQIALSYFDATQQIKEAIIIFLNSRTEKNPNILDCSYLDPLTLLKNFWVKEYDTSHHSAGQSAGKEGCGQLGFPQMTM